MPTSSPEASPSLFQMAGASSSFHRGRMRSGSSDGFMEQNTYVGFCDGERWVEAVEGFRSGGENAPGTWTTSEVGGGIGRSDGGNGAWRHARSDDGGGGILRGRVGRAERGPRDIGILTNIRRDVRAFRR